MSKTAWGGSKIRWRRKAPERVATIVRARNYIERTTLNDTTSTATSDAITLEVFSHRLLSITEEMGAHLIRAAFSPNIKERQDCSVALFDATGRMLAQAAHIPIHLGSLLGGVEAVLSAYPLAQMQPGDAFVCNDAYLAGGTHLPDISIISPVFVDDVPAFFVACLGHHADVGGPVPGSISPSATSIFEEGIRIPPTQIAHAGRIDEGVMRLIAQNTREPEDRVLDLRVQIATNEVGIERIARLVAQMGSTAMTGAIEAMLAYTERRLRNRIRALRDGAYTATVYMDNDGVAGDPVPICATATVRGDALSLDFAGTGPQSRGGFNVMPSGVLATVAYAVKALLDPDLPPNSGLFKAIELNVPPGTILNPHFPAAVGARTTTCQKVCGAIFSALRDVLSDERAMAESHDVLAAMVFSGARQSGGTYVYLETVGGGHGARRDADGMDGAHVHITNSLNMPVEAVETEYPLRVEAYEFIAGSGGDGEHRGGLGIAREVRILADGTAFSARADSFVTAASGAAGGEPGSHCRVVLNPGGSSEQVLDPKQRLLSLNAGDVVRMETPGGAGFGLPRDRAASDRTRDVEDEKVLAP